MREEINEAIDVIAIFYAGKKTAEPFRIRRGSRSYQVKHIHTKWPVKSGEKRELHFSTELDSGDLAELALYVEGMSLQWKLISIDFKDT